MTTINNGMTERQPVTAVWRNGGCSASYDSFVVGSSAVLRLNFCAKNPPLRQAAKRYRSFYGDSATTYGQTGNGLCARSDKPCLPFFAKAKEKQRHPQANAKLLHICFCPTAQRPPIFRFNFYI
jgi:hypothetical protein